MSTMENEQVISTAGDEAVAFWKKPVVLIIAIIVLALAAASISGYFVWNHIQRVEQQKIEQSLYEQQLREQQLAEENERYEQARSEVLIDKFYEGISIAGIAVGGLSLEEAEAEIENSLQQRLDDIEYTVSLEEESWKLDSTDLKVDYNLDSVMQEAWKIGRISGQQTEKAKIYDRQQMIKDLALSPVDLPVDLTYDKNRLITRLNDLADELDVEAVGAEITGFDTGSKKFIVSKHADGLDVSALGVIDSINKDFEMGVLQGDYTFDSEVIPAPNADLAAKVANLGLVSQAKTLASAPNAPRDNNIRLVVRSLNGHVVLPGETFSFNGVIGKRTTAKGYQAAGAIFDGVLIEDVGGGICQPNTTLYQAVQKADLNVVQRSPHTFPSSYTDIGLDAAIDWPGQDMKFVNNTDYPVAIVSWYNKPEIVFQIYGRPLPDGMSISLSADVTANSPPEAPIIKEVDDMKPGTKKEVRAPHNMIRARAYKIWSKNGEFVRSEEIYSSYYPPIRAIIEKGPPKPTPTPTPEPTPTPAETSEEESVEADAA